jgi:predicted AAA+ superfamily ATPase
VPTCATTGTPLTSTEAAKALGMSRTHLVGRDPHLEAMSVAVQRMAIGRFERSVLLTGLRAVGKTVLLNEFGHIAEGRAGQNATTLT